MRHADAGYPEALDAAREGGLDLPSVAPASALQEGAAAPAAAGPTAAQVLTEP